MDRPSTVALFVASIAITVTTCGATFAEPDSLLLPAENSRDATKTPQLSQSAAEQLEKVTQEAMAAIRLERQGEIEAAKQMREQTMESLEKLGEIGPIHFATGAFYCARAYSAARQFDAAFDLLTDAWQRIEPIHDEQATVLRHRLQYTAGGINLAEERFADAKYHFMNAAKLAAAYSGTDTEDYGETLVLLGLTELKLDEFEEATRHFNKAEEIFIAKRGENSERVVSIRNGRATILRLQGDLDSAEKILVGVLKQTPNGERDGDSRLWCQINLAKISIEKAAYQEAEQILKEVCIACQTPGRREEWTASQGSLAKIYRLNGNLSQARTTLDEALKVATNAFPESLDTAGLLHEQALLAAATGNLDAANESINQALQITRTKLPDNHRILKMYEHSKQSILR